MQGTKNPVQKAGPGPGVPRALMHAPYSLDTRALMVLEGAGACCLWALPGNHPHLKVTPCPASNTCSPGDVITDLVPCLDLG